jgi:2-keto-4-pentenoate hydratase
MQSNQSAVKSAFENLKNAFSSGQAIAPVRELIGETDIDTAYAVQEKLVAHFIDQGARKVGIKIGLTSESVQKQLGVNQPDFGVLFAHTHLPNNGKIPFSFLIQPKAEAEMAFVLKESITQPVAHISELLSKIEYVCAAIEIVGSRVENWNIRITDTVADNASASHFVLGEAHVAPGQIDFENAAMELFRNGELVSEGIAKACMGNPLNAVLWLCNTFVEKGVPINKGDIILSGALGPMVPIAAGDSFSAHIAGLGEVSFSVDPL